MYTMQNNQPQKTEGAFRQATETPMTWFLVSVFQCYVTDSDNESSLKTQVKQLQTNDRVVLMEHAMLTTNTIIGALPNSKNQLLRHLTKLPHLITPEA